MAVGTTIVDAMRGVAMECQPFAVHANDGGQWYALRHRDRPLSQFQPRMPLTRPRRVIGDGWCHSCSVVTASRDTRSAVGLPPLLLFQPGSVVITDGTPNCIAATLSCFANQPVKVR